MPRKYFKPKPVTPHAKVKVDKHTGPAKENRDEIKKDPPITVQPSSGGNLAVPQLNTLNFNAEKMKEFGEMEILPLLASAALTPRSKAVIVPKITQKMNFPPNQSVFKNLTPLNVNDSFGELQLTSNVGKSKAKIKKESLEPQLTDYLEKVEPFRIRSIEPEIVMNILKPKDDFISEYNRVYGNPYPEDIA